MLSSSHILYYRSAQHHTTKAYLLSSPTYNNTFSTFDKLNIYLESGSYTEHKAYYIWNEMNDVDNKHR